MMVMLISYSFRPWFGLAKLIQFFSIVVIKSCPLHQNLSSFLWKDRSAWYRSIQSVPKRRLSSGASITSKLIATLASWIESGASLIMPMTFFLIWSTTIILLPSGIPMVKRNFLTTGRVTIDTFALVSKTALIGIPLILTVVLTAKFAILT